MKIVSTLTLRDDEFAELEIIAQRLRAMGFAAKVYSGEFKNAVLTTNAQPRTLRKARQLPTDGNVGALQAMMAQVIGKTKDMNLPPCEVKTK